MAWFTMPDGSGRGSWAFDPDGAAHVIRGNHYNRELIRRSRLIRRDQGFLLPTTTELETDFSDIRAEVSRLARVTVSQLDRDFAADPRKLYEFLISIREDGESAGGSWRQMSQQATRETAQAIASNVNGWENALGVAKFVRDTAAGALFVGATVLSGGAALAVGGAATGLTFTGGTQDNLATNQTMRQAMGNAAISTGFAVVTNLLIPRGLSAVGRGMTGVAASGLASRSLTMGENVALGLISVQANIASDTIKTALTADATSGAVAAEASAQMQRQIGARSVFEIGAMVFQSWLSSRGIPASAFLSRNADGAASVTGGMLGAVGDRIVSAIATQNQQASSGGKIQSPDLDLVLSQLARTMDAENYVREVAMRPS
ncbi:MAG: hypothetical protein JWR10_1053 [Rubritepida sp.]|nr:hypothetical protein [Rubritepida sp.]